MSDPDRDLHRAVADLAELPAGEIEAVLAALPEAQALRIAAILAAPQDQASPLAFGHLSPWLVHRIERTGPMTAHAAGILAKCARSNAPAQLSGAPLPQPSLLSRLGAMLRGQPA